MLPGKSQSCCRLRYKGHLNRSPQWTEERKDSLSREYAKLAPGAYMVDDRREIRHSLESSGGYALASRGAGDSTSCSTRSVAARALRTRVRKTLQPKGKEE
ncbi:MYB DNA-binding domain protein [Penicillium daleae]|uniref:MYB DNA-binding domain protein n=1 Tax=Penicillium daleae TaxID=63821 RepID=A0AAD6C3X2_9EURO|nr:MYB DNA-binding domain protein [Penicillium daleae]KAJ5449539.1 MYB DNA-binding domain protein [Penicillium daleae]